MNPHVKRRAKLASIAVFTITVALIIHFSNNQRNRASTCLQAIGQKLENGVQPELLFQKDFQELQFLVEKSLVARSIALEISNRVARNTNKPLSSKDLFSLKKGTEDYLDIRTNLYSIANAYECATDIDEQTLSEYKIDPALRLKALMLSLGAALTLYDNYMLGIVVFERDDRLRKVVNDPDTGFGLISNKLAEATLAANSVEVRHRARRAIEFYEQEKESLMQAGEDSDFAYLMQLIESSPSFNYVKKIRVGEIAANKFIAFEKLTTDMLDDARSEGLNVVSGLFGNTVGLYEARKGKLANDEAAKKNIQSVLQPLDILLEKTPFRLTDKLIPGHFGHVAIWTGTKAELIDAEVWDEAVIQQYADLISTDRDPHSKDQRQVIEALRNGVQLNTLDHFMNVDDIAILRPVFDEDATDTLTKQALMLAFRQIGKEYDFNFDVNTTDKIVCSELAYVSFPSIDWPTQKTLGRHSISPDHVAELAWNNLPLKLVMLYHDGKLVDSKEQVEVMRKLMTN